jgi:hypothetical protein
MTRIDPAETSRETLAKMVRSPRSSAEQLFYACDHAHDRALDVAIFAGIAANVWTDRPDRPAAAIIEAVTEELRTEAHRFVDVLETFLVRLEAHLRESFDDTPLPLDEVHMRIDRDLASPETDDELS